MGGISIANDQRANSTPRPLSVGKSGNWITNFKIPWHKLPKGLLEACSTNKRPTPSQRREMVRIICDEILQVCTIPGRKALSKVAEMIVAKYGDSFRDTVGDTVIGTGFDSLRKQMEERVFNENRKIKKPGRLLEKLTATTVDDDGDKVPKARKKPICDSYGCINWQPDSFGENETEETQKEKQDWLLTEFPKKKVDKTKVTLLMKQTYASQRLFINRTEPNSPSITEIQQQWPFIFHVETMLLHFQELMGFNLKEVLNQSLQSKAVTIYNYMKKEHSSKKRVAEALTKIDKAIDVDKSDVPYVTGVYLLLPAYFNEPETLLINCYDVSKIIIYKKCNYKLNLL